MNGTKVNRPPIIAQVIVGLAGLINTLAALGLILAPEWFYNNIGNFPPFNRHYEGDAGSFLLPLGIGLLYAARAPHKHLSLVLVGAAANLIHAFNHLYDAVAGRATLDRWLSDTLPLLVLGVLLALVPLYLLRFRPQPAANA